MSKKVLFIASLIAVIILKNSCTSWEPRIDGETAWSNLDTSIAVARNYKEYKPNNTGLGVGDEKHDYYDISIYSNTGTLLKTPEFKCKKWNQHANCDLLYFMESAGYLLSRDANKITGVERWIKYGLADSSFVMLDSSSWEHAPWIVPSTSGTYLSVTHFVSNSQKDSIKILDADNLTSIVSFELSVSDAFVKWICDDTLFAFSLSETDSTLYQISVINRTLIELKKMPTFCPKPYTSSGNYSRRNHRYVEWYNGLMFKEKPIDTANYCL
jgi:hypothetical protein